MKKTLKKVLSLLSIPFLMTGCNEQEDDGFLYLGFSIPGGEQMSSNVLEVGLKVKKIQPLISTLQVYPAAEEGFLDKLESGQYFRPTLEKYTFYLVRRIRNVHDQLIREDLIKLEDFPNDEKYPLTYENMDGVPDGVIYHFVGDYIVDTIDFSSLEISKGRVSYFIDIYDDIKNKSWYESLLDLGPIEFSHLANGGESIKFEKQDNLIFFSNYISSSWM